MTQRMVGEKEKKKNERTITESESRINGVTVRHSSPFYETSAKVRILSSVILYARRRYFCDRVPN